EALSRWMQVSTTEADDALVALGHAVLAAKVKYMRKAMHLISSVRALMEDARWRYVGRAKTMLTTARLLVPPQRSVTLDATGHLNAINTDRPDLFEIVVPAPTRSYSSAKVYVLRTSRGTGKEITERPAFTSMARGALKSIQAYYGAETSRRKVLVVTHQ